MRYVVHGEPASGMSGAVKVIVESAEAALAKAEELRDLGMRVEVRDMKGKPANINEVKAPDAP